MLGEIHEQLRGATERRRREQRRHRRRERDVPVVSLVGYTNAGKSTLLNLLTRSEVFVEHRMFATLDPTSRRLRLPRDREIVIICRSGNRSVLAAVTMQMMGYNRVASLKTGLRGWNDYELELVDAAGITVNIDQADEYFTTHLRPDQMSPR